MTYEGIEYEVTSIGEAAFLSCTALKSIIISDSVTAIGPNAFDGCTSLTSVTIPEKVTSIGDSAFYGCTSLTFIEVEEGNTAYSSEEGVLFDKSKTTLIQYPVGKKKESYDVPDSVTSIADAAFYGCTSLTSVTIPGSVTTIAGSAFMGCTSLTSIEVEEGNTAYSSEEGVLFDESKTTLIQYPVGKKKESYDIPDSVTFIIDSAFRGCTSLTSVTIPEKVTTIAGSAFMGCTSLTSVTFLGSVTDIEYEAFSGCTSLTSVTIPDSVTFIGSRAFMGCTSLTSVTIPEKVTSIRDSAFYGCTSLTSVTIPEKVTYIGDEVFYECTSLTSIVVNGSNKNFSSDGGVLFNKSKTILMQYPAGKKDSSSYTIPSSVTSIDPCALDGCIFLTSIEVEEGNTAYSSDGGVLFNKSKTILMQYPAGKKNESYVIPDSVTSIADSTFRGCTALTSVTIHGSVTTIGAEVFYGCTSLESIKVEEGNTVYSSEGGVLFNKSKTNLMQYPAGKNDSSYVIPDSVTYIKEYAFYGCTSLESVTIPGKDIHVSINAFVDCTSLETIRITGGIFVIFDESSIKFTDGTEHTLYVVAPEGFVIPGDAVSGDVKIVYGEKPSGSDGFPIVYAAVGIVAALALIGGAVVLRRRRV